MPYSGELHRKRRRLMNPLFDNDHIRDLEPLFYRTVNEVSNLNLCFSISLRVVQLRDRIAKQVGSTGADVELLDWMASAALELIGQGGLGHSFNALDINKPSPYKEALRNLV